MDKLLSKLTLPSPIEKVSHPILYDKNISLWIKRDDLIHPFVSGNKWRKLKHNLVFALEKELRPVITYGGAYSNHLYAVAGACSILNIPSIGIVRGELDETNPTLKFCREQGMKLIAQPRSDFRLKNDSFIYKELKFQHPNAYTIPEGGTNELALIGVAELWPEMKTQIDFIPDYITTSCGTGGTTAGLTLSCDKSTEILSFSALKTEYLANEISSLQGGRKSTTYAKYDQVLLNKIEGLAQMWQIPLDHVYNGKALIGLLDMVEKGKILANSKIVHIHTGGIQGKVNYVK
jgi:1-aminocyclopropane-1-carboxylate deaminase